MSDHSERMEDAIRQALASRAGSLASIASSYYNNLTASGYLRVCPFCQDKGQKFCIKRATAGHWYWGCHKPACPVNIDTLKSNGTADTIGFLMVHDGTDRNAAVDKLLSLTGTPNPRHDLPPKRPRKSTPKTPAKTTPPPQPPTADPQAESAAAPSDETPTTVFRTTLPGTATPEQLQEALHNAVKAVADHYASPEDPADSSNSGEPSDSQDPPDAPNEEESPTLLDVPASPRPPEPDNIVGFSLKDGVPPPPPTQPDKTVWDDIWQRLSLNAGDREELKRKRGFNKDTIEAGGFRSNGPDNTALLQPVIAAWDEELLLEEGIVTKDGKSGDLRLNAQLRGYGLVKRAQGKDQKDEWGWTNPILIPYFNEDGSVIGIRPHKGGLSGKRHMQEQGFELGFRRKRIRVKPHFNKLIWNQPDEWRGRCVLTEGEFKAWALYQAGIPAAAVPGIQMPRNDMFLEALAEELKAAGIKEVIVCFDCEDKSHKPDPWTRHDTEVYQLFACHALRVKGFITYQVTLPEEWQVDKKADWDGALAKFGAKAPAMFDELLKEAKRYYEQFEMFGMDEKQRIIHCKLNRLTAQPTILTGGEDEEELARLILKTPRNLWIPLQIRAVAQELFDTRGCYYLRKKKAIKDLKWELKELEKYQEKLELGDYEDAKEREGLEATIAALEHIIEGRPEIQSDFTIECEYLLRKADGKTEQLMRFTNKYGEKSTLISVPSEAIAGAMRFREFCRSVGNFNLIMGDKQIQQLQIDIGKLTAWREIRELEMLGQDKESGLWIFGDCAFTADCSVVFPDDRDVLWHHGIGYRIAPEDLKDLAHKLPPKFFQKLGMEPHEVLAEILKDPQKEEIAVAGLVFQLSADLIATFGDAAGLLILGATLAYCVAPELLKKYNGHPGIWVHGLFQAGKTETAITLMMIWGYAADYRTASLSKGSTNVGIDRWLAQYSNILMHLDEFRQKEADDTRIAGLRMPFNRQAKGKGRLDQTNKTRTVEPATSPLVTGEGITGDSATLSRYVEGVLSVDKRLGTRKQQIERFKRMRQQSTDYHRIVRWLMMNRTWFATEMMATMETFATSDEAAKNIPDRLRITYGAAYSAYWTLFTRFAKDPAIAVAVKQLAPEDQWLLYACATGVIPKHSKDLSPETIKLLRAEKTLEQFTIEYASKAAAEVISINFTVRFWSNVMDLFQRNHDVRKFIWFERCSIDPATNRVEVTTAKADHDGLVRCVIVNWGPLFSEVEKDLRQRGGEPDLGLAALKRQTSTEKYYVPGPTHGANQSHRISRDKKQVTVTVLRCDRMEPSLEAAFADQFETEDETAPLSF